VIAASTGKRVFRIAKAGLRPLHDGAAFAGKYSAKGELAERH
jgi:hypothetical protein